MDVPPGWLGLHPYLFLNGSRRGRRRATGCIIAVWIRQGVRVWYVKRPLVLYYEDTFANDRLRWQNE